MKTLVHLLILVAFFDLSGCRALTTAIDHRNLTIDSRMSDTIFLDPVPPAKKTIYVQVKNTTPEDISDLKKTLTKQLASHGWRIVKDVNKAHEMVQVSVRQVGKAPSPESVWESMSSGYGGTVALGGLAGLTMGPGARNPTSTALGIGLLVGGVASWVGDRLAEDVTYSVITDVQVSVRTDKPVTQTARSNLSQGSKSTLVQSYSKAGKWLRYRTRVASLANKMNLEFESAKPLLTRQLAKEVAGIFGD